jgi:hypothetical protein
VSAIGEGVFAANEILREARYDVKGNEGWVSVGIDHDTAEFAGEAATRAAAVCGKRQYKSCLTGLISPYMSVIFRREQKYAEFSETALDTARAADRLDDTGKREALHLVQSLEKLHPLAKAGVSTKTAT